MDISDSGTPISSSDWDELELGINQSSLNGNLDFLGNLDSNTNESLSVTNSDDSLESGSLTGLGLLLDGEDAHDLIRELSLLFLKESISDLMLLDWDGVSVDLLKGSDDSESNKSSELGLWMPFLFSLASVATWATSSSASATAATSS